jgi:hypothetical protein
VGKSGIGALECIAGVVLTTEDGAGWLEHQLQDSSQWIAIASMAEG